MCARECAACPTLRNHRSISPATRKRIQGLARRMGCKPDPVLTALAAHRVAIRTSYRYGLIAVLCHRAESEGLPHYIQDKLEGIRTRAVESGFDIELCRVPAKVTGQGALCRSLYHRGIRGILVCPLPWEPSGFDFSKFTPVGIGENAMPLGINYVSYDHAIHESYRELSKRGYRNIGFCNLRESEERNRHLFSASRQKCRSLNGAKVVSPLLLEEGGIASLRPWQPHGLAHVCVSSYLDAVPDLAELSLPVS